MRIHTYCGQVVQAARARRPVFDPGYRRGGDFSSLVCVLAGPGAHSASYKISTVGGVRRRIRRPSVGLATLPFPSAVAVYMWNLASTSFMASNGDTFTVLSIHIGHGNVKHKTLQNINMYCDR